MRKVIFFLFCVSLAIPCAAETFTIGPDGPNTIQETIDMAYNGDIIKLKKGEYKGEGNYNISFKGKRLTIRPNKYDETEETIVVCSNKSFGFVFEEGEGDRSILTRITIQGSDSNDLARPAAINCLGTSPIIDRCIITGCTTGIYVKGDDPNDNSQCSPTIERCDFTKSKKNGKHAVRLEDCTVELEDCSIDRNVGAGNGAGVYNARSDVTITDCLFNRNSAKGQGGSVFVDDSIVYQEPILLDEGDPNDPNDDVYSNPVFSENKGSLRVFDCEFSENESSEGGGIYSKIGDVFVEYCPFYYNTGGGVYVVADSNNYGPLVLYNCNFGYNLSDQSTVYCENNNFKASYCNIYRNEGGGIYIDSNDVYIYNCSVTDHEAGGAGGGIYVTSDSNETGSYIENCSIEGNSDLFSAPLHVPAGEITITGCSINDNTANKQGGGIYISNQNQSINKYLWISDCDITYNNTRYYDDDYDYYYHEYYTYSGLSGAGIFSEINHAIISNCYIYDNGVSGILQLADSNDGSLTILDSTVVSNESEHSGVYTDVNNVSVSNCDISYNRYGGIIVKSDSNDGYLEISNSYLNNNRDGGGIYSILDNVNIENCQIGDNGGSGIAVVSDSNFGRLAVSDCQIYNNRSYYQDVNNFYAIGDGIYSEVNDVAVSRCDIFGNYDNGVCVVTDSNEGTLVVSDSTITSNLTSKGAIYAEVNYAAVNNCSVSGNNKGIYIMTNSSEGSVDIYDSTIEENSTFGIYAQSGGNITISDCIVNDHWNNGIYAVSNNQAAKADILDCLITKNKGSEGAGIYISLDPNNATSASVRNCTILGNLSYSGTKSAVWIESGQSINVNSCIIRDNKTNQLTVSDESITTVEYSDITGGWEGIGNIDEDPFFVLEGKWEDGVWVNGNYHPLIGSPCIDTGDPNFIAAADDVDLDGDPRIKWGRVDMGSDESINRILPIDANGMSDYATIQDAVNDANVWDFLSLSPGTYKGPGNRDIDFLGKDLILESLDTDDPNIVTSTIIDCNGTWDDPHNAFYLVSGEGHPTRIEGITIKNGYGHYNMYQFALYSLGGGVYCDGSSTYVRKCVFVNNDAEFGGAVFGNPAQMEDNLFYDNFAKMEGGALYLCGNVIRSKLVGNTANRGGAMSYCYGSIIDCNITDNKAIPNHIEEFGYGGGIYASDGMILQCNISNNQADLGGGLNLCNGSIVSCEIRDNNDVGVYGCDGQIISCNIIGNSSKMYGGGLFDCMALINGSTIADNSAGIVGGGIATCPGPITNSILWGNTAGGVADQLADSNLPSYSCIEGCAGAGIGNIDVDPEFIDAENGNYHLAVTSPCINAGDPAFATWTCIDIDGQIRVNGLAIDMGADEVVTGDINQDDTVNHFDYVYFANSWGSQPGDDNWCAACDLNQNGVIDAYDLTYLAENWLD